MPKETFFNLQEDKREKIISIALEEFAVYDYKTASLTRIVEAAGISKGSMYQYFENKKDLYLFLLHLAAEKKLSFITRSLDPKETDFFKKYKQMLLIATKFDLGYPEYSRLIHHAGRETNTPELEGISSKLLQMSDQYMEHFVSTAQKAGQLRKDLDTDLIAFLISRLSIDLADYNSTKFNFSYGQLIQAGGGSLPMSDEALEKVLDHLIEFFKNGLQV